MLAQYRRQSGVAAGVDAEPIKRPSNAEGDVVVSTGSPSALHGFIPPAFLRNAPVEHVL